MFSLENYTKNRKIKNKISEFYTTKEDILFGDYNTLTSTILH